MAKFQFSELVSTPEIVTARLGSTTGDTISDKEVGKLVKLAGDSRYDVCTAGDEFEGKIVAFASYPMDGYAMGSVQKEDRIRAVVSGTTLVIGDFVVAGAQPAKGTALSVAPAVQKALSATTFKWRVVALYGNGSAGTEVLVEFIY